LLYRKYWLYPALCRNLRGRVLDVGCGMGDLLRHRPGTTGVDINPHAVEWCRTQGLDVHLMRPDILPFENHVFQGVMLDNVLEHLLQPLLLLGEIRRVLAPSGILVVGVPGQRGYNSDPDHKVFYDAAALKGVVETAGFCNLRLLHMPFPIPGLGLLMRQYCLYGVFEAR